MSQTARRRAAGFVVGLLLLIAFIVNRRMCLSAYLTYGLDVRECPDGKFRQTAWARAYSLKRGQPGTVNVGAQAHYAVADNDYDRTVEVPELAASLMLVDPTGKETALEADKEGWKGATNKTAAVTLPPVPDGDYLLRAIVKTRIGTDHIDLPLPIYAPAEVHVITDRPLYQPGDLIKFRAVVLRARDLHPLTGRPGHWEVRDPTGELLLEEKAPAGDWGVVAGTFPLDGQAATGTWHVAWVSGGAHDEVNVRVEPFVLPRFRLEANALQPSYRPHDKPVIKGRVVYSSGAPVAKAKVEITWTNGGSWPPPTDWMTKTLPHTAEADADGNFTLNLPEVPADLQGQATLSARLAATDAAGDRVEGGASVLLSEDAIQVTTVTELQNGLVEGFNNRLFLRATTASGEPLPGVALSVKRSWEPTDPGVNSETDTDGVAQVQIDPGPPVNVVIPPPPFRPQPLPPAVSRTDFEELMGEKEPSLAEMRAADGWEPSLAACARFTDGSGSASVVARVDATGAIRAVGTSDDSPISDCAARVMRDKHLTPGDDRLIRVGWNFSSEGLPRLETNIDDPLGMPDGLPEAFHDASLDARRCLPAHSPNAVLRKLASWSVRAESKEVVLSWIPDRTGDAPATVSDCVALAIPKLSLKRSANRDLIGIAHFDVGAARVEENETGQATTLLGYELTISARRGSTEIGHTKIRLTPGSVPSLRIRATPTLAKAGDTVEVELLRGPDYAGELPEKVYVTADELTLEAAVDKDTRKASFTLPANVRGWVELRGGSSQALVYVRSDAELSVALSTDKPRYAPGQTARLGIQTRIGDQGAPAAVGLFGVDESLGQLATLPGPDDMARVRPKVSTPAPAFGSLDGQALTMGRIRGANAAMATVLRVSGRPLLPELDLPVSATGDGSFDPVSVLTDHFYEVLSELHVQARTWEEKAPATDKMHPPQMAVLWTQAIAAAKARGVSVDDAYGRALRLSHLPPDLLALTDPRAVIVQGTRLPEDVENWTAYVAKEKP